ncbi:MAG: ADP-ribosylglycohydrolase family protein, partial [Anaerolineales bacterium]|nr:ADP-ribosylglycohydrolase family protein [Anaerolineales bacterium]
GDALGTTLEFRSPGSFAPIQDMVGGGPFSLSPGEWTDDTSMALCLAESLINCQGMDLSDQMQRYVRWFREGYLSSTGACFDIGNTVRSALENFEKTGNPLSGSTDPFSAGNGSIMRLAPVPMYFADDLPASIRNSARSSLTTHGTRTAVDACRYFGALITGALNGVAKRNLLSDEYFADEDPLIKEIEQIARGSFKKKQPADIKGTGYVVQSLEAALWAFNRSDSFESGCLMAVNLGDDADTTGAVFGQIAGAFYGEAGIPNSWVSRIALKDLIRSFADQIYGLAKGFD